MDIVRSAKQNVKIKSFALNSDEEVTVKIVYEILNLFKIEILAEKFLENDNTYDYESLSIANDVVTLECAKVVTTVTCVTGDGIVKKLTKEKTSRLGEKIPAAIRRLIKLNLYDIFLSLTREKGAPWGILHGVRPTKIIHKYIDEGMSKDEIIMRLKNDYYVDEAKAELISTLAFKQRPFLAVKGFNMVSLYIGIPFCLSRCHYCSFPSYILPKEEILQQFLLTLRKDILAAKDVISKNKLLVQNIYIGGGTPTSLPVKEFTELLELIKNLFLNEATVEFTVEAGRPDSVNDEKIKAMMQNSVNRVSVNPQTMQEKTLKHIGRKHTIQDIIELFDKFRCAGMENINMDVIIGLPGETAEDVEDTMKKITVLNPDNITLHALALKRGSILKTNREVYLLPNDETTMKMFDIAMQYAENLGMEPYYLYRQGYMRGNLENIGYSKKGAEGLYNIQIMEERQTIIGIGPAATTKVINTDNWSMVTSFNAKDLTTYLNSVDKYIERRTTLINHAYGNKEE